MKTQDKANSIKLQAETLANNIIGYASAYHVAHGDWFKMWAYNRGEGMSKHAILADIRKLRRDLLSLSRDIESGNLRF